MKYKPINKNLINQAIDLRIQYFYEAYSNFSVENENELRVNLKNDLEKHLNKDCFILIVEENGLPVSTAILEIHHKLPNMKIPNGRYGEIYGVFTLAEYRKKGYATNLIYDLIELGNELGLSFIELDAAPKGLGIYKKCGFEQYVDEQYTKMRYINSHQKKSIFRS